MRPGYAVDIDKMRLILGDCRSLFGGSEFGALLEAAFIELEFHRNNFAGAHTRGNKLAVELNEAEDEIARLLPRWPPSTCLCRSQEGEGSRRGSGAYSSSHSFFYSSSCSCLGDGWLKRFGEGRGNVCRNVVVNVRHELGVSVGGDFVEGLNEARASLLQMPTFTIPTKAPSVANLRQHWRAKANLAAKHRRDAMLHCPRWTAGPLLVVKLTRCAPRELDSDNLASACKNFRDGIAARLRIDDGSALIEWKYAQAKCAAGEECVRVEIEAKEAEASSI